MAIERLILSHKRAGQVKTHLHIPDCKLVVPESQADDYAKHHPGVELVTHPDSVVGIWAKRQWCWERFGSQMQFDDEFVGFYRCYRTQGSWKKPALGPERAVELIEATADRARKLGAYLFGFGHHIKPEWYDGFKPFRFGRYTRSGALGLLEGGKFWWPTDVTLGDGDDYWICLLNAHYHRYAFFDRRFCAHFDDFYDPDNPPTGGLEEFRTEDELEDEATTFLQRHFGREVIYVPFDTVKDGHGQTVMATRRRIDLPYRA